MKTDIQIAQEASMKNVIELAEKLNIDHKYLESYGNYKAKIDNKLLNELKDKKDGKLILVTAINPTPAGEGKTTTTVGLCDSINALNKTCIAALREPSLGPVFGVKGGAAGGGYAQVVPMEDINLHFTGDFHAITAANNLLAAMLDNHIHQGNKLNIDTRKIVWKRCVDMNDRQLRSVVDGLGNRSDGYPRQDGFDITVASEVMAILCLSKDILDLKERLGKIIVAYDINDKPITAKDLKANGAMAVLLKDAIKPNLVQTLENNPVIIHGGPFANIAHGCNSIIATKLALKLADYTVTEAGFGADLGAEKFLDIKCRLADLKVNCVVIVATIRALKHHGGSLKEELNIENLDTLEKGLPNLLQHISNIKNVYNLPCVVALNIFSSDTDKEIELVSNKCKELNVEVSLSSVFENGSKGGIDLAQKVIKLCDEENNFKYAYDDNDSILEKIKKINNKIYHGNDVILSNSALKQIKQIEDLGYSNLPVCMAKTQYSFSDEASLLAAPKDFNINIKDVKLCAGANFVVVKTKDIMTMPGLPKTPAAENIDIDEDGKIVGLF